MVAIYFGAGAAIGLAVLASGVVTAARDNIQTDGSIIVLMAFVLGLASVALWPLTLLGFGALCWADRDHGPTKNAPATWEVHE